MQSDLQHNMLVFYTIKSLAQKNKVKLLRELHGYKEKKKGKKYVHAGILEHANGQKLGSNVILVPIFNFADIQNFFSKHNIMTEVKEVWLK